MCIWRAFGDCHLTVVQSGFLRSRVPGTLMMECVRVASSSRPAEATQPDPLPGKLQIYNCNITVCVCVLHAGSVIGPPAVPVCQFIDCGGAGGSACASVSVPAASVQCGLPAVSCLFSSTMSPVCRLLMFAVVLVLWSVGCDGKPAQRVPQSQLRQAETNPVNFIRLVVMRLIYGLATRVGLGENISEAFNGAFVPPGVDEYSDYDVLDDDY